MRRTRRPTIARWSGAAGFLAVSLAAGCVPHVQYTDEQIPTITKLDDLMTAQAAAADPQFKKIGAATYADADFAAFNDTGRRIQATSAKIKDFSKGPEFDALAVRLGDQARALTEAAVAKDADRSRAALVAMKSVCKECHSKFK